MSEEKIVYSHKFRLQCAHFNGQPTYDVYWQCLDALNGIPSLGSNRPGMHEEPKSYPDPPRLERVIEAFQNQHGHNFDIEVTVSGILHEGDIWLCDDIAIAKIVMAWDNVNLSCLPEFSGPRVRATTELMAIVLVGKITQLLKTDDHVRVRVYETEGIYAEAYGTA